MASRLPRRKLESWKEIAAYLGRSVNTAQRWERDEAMPVHRHRHNSRGSVFAFSNELDVWMERRADRAAQPAPPRSAASLRPSSRAGAIVGAALLALGAGAAYYLFEPAAPAGLGEVAPLTRLPGREREPAVSPDGRTLAYTWQPAAGEDSYLHLQPLNGDGGRPVRLTRSAEPEGSPAFSPDGRRLAYLRRPDHPDRSIIVRDLESGLEREVWRMRHGAFGDGLLEWSGDGETLYFVDRPDPDQPLRVLAHDLDSGAARPVTSPPPGSFGDAYFAFAPDGESLALAHCRVDGACRLLIQQGERLEPVSAPPFSQILGLCWTPDGDSIVYSSDHGGMQELWCVRRNSAGWGRPKQLTHHLGYARHPQAIPSNAGDGFRIAYQLLLRSDHIWIMDLVGPHAGRARQVTAANASDYEPSLSPDGERVVFSSDRSGHRELWVCGVDSRDCRPITAMHKNYLGPARWSPDGEWIAFGGPGGSYLARPDGAELRFLATDLRMPRWSWDSRTLFGSRSHDGVDQIWLAPLNDPSQATPLTALGGYNAMADPERRAIYYTKFKHAPEGLWRRSLAGGPEGLFAAGVRAISWAASREGVYYVDFRDGALEKTLPRDVLYQAFAGGPARVVATIPAGAAKLLVTGFDITPDGRRIAWAQRDLQIEDIMMVKLPR